MWILGGLAAATVLIGVGGHLLSRWGKNWGATQEEIVGEMAGDELLMDDIVVPASAGTVFRSGLEQAGIPTIGYWAQVPQYVGRPYQPAMQALLEKIAGQLEVEIDLTAIELEAQEQIERLDDILAKRSDARDFVEGLELSVGTTSKVPTTGPPSPR